MPAPASSTSDNALATFSFPAMNNPSIPPPPTTNKRNSHHRRRSSVSTRTESAELMGVSLPELPPSNSDTNVNFGDKDSIRRRALWALEGKPDVSFAKVEIPDIATPDLEKTFDFRQYFPLIRHCAVTDYLSLSATKPSFQSVSGTSFGSSLGGKRDSFKLLAASSSSKDQLHTLVEEEEEEEEVESTQKLASSDEDVIPGQSVVGVAESKIVLDESEVSFAPSDIPKDKEDESVTSTVAEVDIVQPLPARPRPAALHLRPLSLTPESLSSLQGLPPPSWTPAPRSGLKRLSLSPIPPGEEAQHSVNATPTPAPRRPPLSLILGSSNENPLPTPGSEDPRPQRRSSITYKTPSHGVTMSLAGLPTPEMTPTFNRRYSIAESVRSTRSEDEFFPGGSSQNRPLSASEQHFLVKSHNALLARITDLERALTSRRRISFGYTRSETGSSRPTSLLSDVSSSDTGSEPSDEMLRLIADLKAERDELKRDVDGWRTRVGDMEKQMTMLTKRVEAERRDAWVARSQAGLLEVEKGAMEKKLESTEKVVEELSDENQSLKVQKEDLAKENEEVKKKMQELEEQLKATRMELEKERELRKLREEEILATSVIRAPSSRPRSSYGRNAGTAFASIDSIASSATVVEEESSDDCEARFSFLLRAVQEEEEPNEDNGLAGYEDEGDSDASFRSSSSFDSMDDQTSVIFQPSTPSTPKPRDAVFTFPAPDGARGSVHQSSPSWSKTWTFPRVANAQPVQHHDKQDSVDRFFGCLEDDGGSSCGSSPSSPSQYSLEKSKSMFSAALKEVNEDDSPFFLPPGIGVMVEEKRLGAVLEEEEEEETTSDDESDGEMFGEMGGIRITLSPPQPEDDVPIVEPPQLVVQTIKRPVEKAPQLPMLNFGDDEDDAGFSFGRALEQARFDEEEESVVPAVVVSPPVIAVSPPAVVQTPPPSIPCSTSSRSTSPSAIPRFSAFKSAAPTEFAPKTTTSSSPTAYVTPPSKRGGTTPSFIPQSVSSPSPIRTAPASVKSKLSGTMTFIRPPQRRPLTSTTAGNFGRNETSANGSNPTSRIAIRTC